MRFPFDGRNRVTSPYGQRKLNGIQGWHAGLDIVGDDSNLVRSVCTGTVYSSTRLPQTSRDRTWQWGNYVCVHGDDGRYYYYCHLASRAVTKGQRVAEGDRLGVMGSTGYAFGAHTHFEVRQADRHATISPAAILGIPNRRGTYVTGATSKTRLRITAANCEYFGEKDIAQPLGKLKKGAVYPVKWMDTQQVTLSACGKSYAGKWLQFTLPGGKAAWCLALSDRTVVETYLD